MPADRAQSRPQACTADPLIFYETKTALESRLDEVVVQSRNFRWALESQNFGNFAQIYY